MDNLNGFSQVLSVLPEVLSGPLQRLPEADQRRVTEIRLRQGQPLSLSFMGETVFLTPGGRICFEPGQALAVTEALLEQTLLNCCGHSLHSCADQLRQGFVTLPGGHRVGVAGTARVEQGQVLSVHRITSLNIRIASRIPGAGDLLLEKLFGSGLGGGLIAGPPLSGKTTLLKSMIARLAGGWRGSYRKVAVIDERGELAGCGGVTADILTGYPKAAAMELALRSLSPQLLCCDELSAGEAGQVLDAVNAGVPLLCTIHASSPWELGRKRWLRPLLEQEVFEKVAFLGSDQPGKLISVESAGHFLSGDAHEGKERSH